MMRFLLKLMQNIHRIAGTVLSLLFVVWFLSGFVMIYHSFPKVSIEDRISKLDYLTPPAIGIDKVDSIGRVKSLQSYLGERTFRIEGKGYNATNLKEAETPEITLPYVEMLASLWCNEKIQRIDTLRKLDQWIPFGHLTAQMPIYKVHFEGETKQQLYVSSKTGDVLQFTNRTSRFWAWLGAIPHWVYFTQLRKNAPLWIDTVVWLSAIGSVMVIAGIYLGVRIFIKLRKRGKGFSPYRKRWYHWHYVTGLLFGLFVFTFTFSGMMSLSNTSGWFAAPDISAQVRKSLSQPLDISQYALDYRTVIATYPNKIRQMEWSNFHQHPIYILHCDGGKRIYIDASANEIETLSLSPEAIKASLQQVHGTNSTMTMEWMEEYDTYYAAKKQQLSLPVWKVAISDDYGSSYYIDPTTGNYRYVSNNHRLKHWLYPALHSYRIGWLINRPILWNILMWGTMIGGTIVSLTGLYLSCRFIRRKIGRKASPKI